MTPSDSIPGLDTRRVWPPWLWLLACAATGLVMCVHAVTSPIWSGPLGLRALAILALAEGVLAISAYLGWAWLRGAKQWLLALALLPIPPFIAGAFLGTAALETLGFEGDALRSVGGLVLHLAIQLTAPLVAFGAYDSSLLLMLIAGLIVLGTVTDTRNAETGNEFSFPAFGCALVPFVGEVYGFTSWDEEAGAPYPVVTCALFFCAVIMAPLLAAALRAMDGDVARHERRQLLAVPTLGVASIVLFEGATIFSWLARLRWIHESADGEPSWPEWWAAVVLVRVLPAIFAFGVPFVLARSKSPAPSRPPYGLFATLGAAIVVVGTYAYASDAFDRAQHSLYEARAAARGEPLVPRR